MHLKKHLKISGKRHFICFPYSYRIYKFQATWAPLTEENPPSTASFRKLQMNMF